MIIPERRTPCEKFLNPTAWREAFRKKVRGRAKLQDRKKKREKKSTSSLLLIKGET